MSEKNLRIKILTGVADVFGYSFTELSLSIYLECLSSLKSDDLERILTYGIKSNVWKAMPKPGEILAVVKLSEATKSAISAKQEFEMIMSSIRKNGRQVLPLMSPTTQQALRQCGGLNRLAEASNDQLPWIRKEFENCYALECEREAIGSRINKLDQLSPKQLT
jgi:hypothetical protein